MSPSPYCSEASCYICIEQRRADYESRETKTMSTDFVIIYRATTPEGRLNAHARSAPGVEQAVADFERDNPKAIIVAAGQLGGQSLFPVTAPVPSEHKVRTGGYVYGLDDPR